MAVSPFLFSKSFFKDPACLTGVLFFSCILICIAAPRALSFMPSLCGLFGAIMLWRRNGAFPRPPRMDVLLVGGMGILAFISAFWSYDVGFGIEKGLKIALTLLAGVLFIDTARRMDISSSLSWLPGALGAVLIFGGAMTSIEHLAGYPLMQWISGRAADDPWLGNKYNRTEVLLAACYLPVLWIILHAPTRAAFRYVFAGVLSLTTFVAMYSSHSQTAQLGILVFVAAFILWPARRAWAWRIAAAVTAAGILLAPFIAIALYQMMPADLVPEGIMAQASIPHRLVIWHFTATEALRHPIFGHGLEALRYLKTETPMPYVKATHILHPHNSFLQIWVEMGLAGALLAAIFAIHTIRQIGGFVSAGSQKLGMGMLAGCVVISLTGFGFWQGYQMGLYILAGALTILAVRFTRSDATH